MARDGNGNADFIWGPHNAGDVIDEVSANAAFVDLEQMLTTSIATDGQSVITANLPMSGYRHTGVDDAVARTDYASAGQVQDSILFYAGVAGGTANALTLSMTPQVMAYAAGQRFVFVASATNTGATTVAVSALAATAIRSNGSALVGGEIVSGNVYSVTYYNSLFHLAEESPIVTQTFGKRNYIVNPRANIAQWGVTTSIAGSTGAYVIDGWAWDSGATTTTLSRQTMTLGTATWDEQQYFMRTTSSTAAQGTWTLIMEDVRTLAGKTVTLTIEARSSSANATLTPSVNQSFGTGGSTQVQHAGSAITLTTSFARYSRTFTLGSISDKTIGTGSRLDVTIAVGAAAGLNVDIAYVQLESGPFSTKISPKSIEAELQECQRFYQHSYESGTAVATVSAAGATRSVGVTAASVTNSHIIFPVAMRASPTITLYSPVTGTAARIADLDAVADRAAVVIGTSSKAFNIFGDGAVITVGNQHSVHWVANARL